MTTTTPARPGRDPHLDNGLAGTDIRIPAALGVGMLGAAVVMAVGLSRFGSDLDHARLACGVVAAVALLAISAGGWLTFGADAALPGSRARLDALVAWPGAVGVAGAGLVLADAFDYDGGATYAAGLLVLLLGSAGAVRLRSGAFVLAAITGLAVGYARLVHDLVGLTGGDYPGIRPGVALVVFVLLVTGLGWTLPATRVLSALVAGAVAVVGLAVILTGLAAPIFIGFFRPALHALHLQLEPSPCARLAMVCPPVTHPVDVWVLLGLALLLVVVWGVLAARTGHVGFRVLITAMALLDLPLATFALLAHHLVLWAVVVGGIGTVLLVSLLVRDSTEPGRGPTEPGRRPN